MSFTISNMFKLLLLSLVCASALTLNNSTIVNDDAELIHLHGANSVILRGPVTSASIDRVISDISKLVEDDIYLYIHSPGGSVIDGERLVQTIQALERTGKKIHGVTDLALSMGFDIFQTCTTRYITKGGILMQHQMSSRVGGNIRSMREMMNWHDYLYNVTCQYQADRIGMTLNDFQDRVNDEWWLYDRQAIEQNVADKSALVLCSTDLIEDTEEIVLYTWFGPVTIVYSKCPLITHPLDIRFGSAEESFNYDSDMSKLSDRDVYDMSIDYMKSITLVH